MHVIYLCRKKIFAGSCPAWYLFGLALFVAGCANWSDVKKQGGRDKGSLPKAKMSVDSVILEAIFLRLNASQEPSLQSVWRQVDEQALDIEVRRKLDANGIRAGVISGDIPPMVQGWLDLSEKRMREDMLEQAHIAADVSSIVQRLQCRNGRAKELIVRSQKQGQISIFHMDGVATGKTYDQPTLLFELLSKPHGDGTATIIVTPEIQHGATKSTIVGENVAFRREFQRDTVTFKDLRMESRLRPGQILIMTGTAPTKGIGEHFFQTMTAANDLERVVLLVRLAQTQLDDLFAPEHMKVVEIATDRP